MKALLVIDVEEDMIGEVDYTAITKGNMCNGRAELKPMPEKQGVKSIEFIPKGRWEIMRTDVLVGMLVLIKY